jgi:tetratricopeptide (TPR) repeat protein
MPFNLWQSKRTTDPIGEMTKRLDQNPRDVLALVERAGALLAKRDAAAALRDVERALQIAVLEPALQGELRARLLARLYSLQSRALAGLGNWPQAMASAERALNERPDDIDALAQRGRIRRETDDLNGAMADFNRALELDNGFAEAYLARGMVRYETGDYENSVADCSQAIQLNKSLGVAWSNRGRAYLALHQLPQAENDFRTALRLDPLLIFAYAGLASATRLQGKLNEALGATKDGLTQHPHEPMLLIELARIRIDQKRLPEALSTLNAVLQYHPDDTQALALRGQIYGRSGRTETALQDLSRAVQLDPNNPETHFNHALALLYAGHPEAALAAVSRVLQLTPDDREAHTWRVKLARDLGLEPLDEVARVLESFAYSHCGPGRNWKVELREMYAFRPGKRPEAYNAALLDLCQVPQSILQVRMIPGGYIVLLQHERPVPNIDRTCFAEVVSKTIPTGNDALLGLLNSFVDQEVLVKVGNRLRCSGKAGSNRQ